MKRIPLATQGIALLLLTCACTGHIGGTEAFPGYEFGGDKNNMLDYPDDPDRVEYTGERLGHRSKDQLMVAIDDNSDREIPRPEPVQRVSDDDIEGEIGRTLPLSLAEELIRPTPLLDGDVKLDDGQNTDIPKRTPVPTAAGWRAGVFLASYRSEVKARNGWRQVTRKFAAPLEGLRAEILRVDLGAAKGGIYYRLFAVPLENNERAAALCGVLGRSDQFCRTAAEGGQIQW